MPDNPKKTGKADRSKVAGGQDYEIDYLRRKTGASEAAIKAAIKKVGNDRAKIEAELKKR